MTNSVQLHYYIFDLQVAFKNIFQQNFDDQLNDTAMCIMSNNIANRIHHKIVQIE